MLTLLGFIDGQECWVTQDRNIISWCKTWFISDHKLDLRELDAARESYFLSCYNSWLEARDDVKNIIAGLTHCILPDLIPMVTHYFSAMFAAPMPSPRGNIHWALSPFRTESVIAHEEQWMCNNERYLYCTTQAIWYHVRISRRAECSSLTQVLLNTCRAQILGLRHDKLV